MSKLHKRKSTVLVTNYKTEAQEQSRLKVYHKKTTRYAKISLTRIGISGIIR